ncbi:MAG: hypothetical protein ACRDFB_09560, partial [Rhabdochlamydiaceae bacterium]
FTECDFPPPDNPLVFTVCYHIFHLSCLAKWVTTPVKDCPTCRTVVYKLQAGKDYKVYWGIFLKALQHDPNIVCDTLDTSDHKNEECAVCNDELPLIPLRYDPKKKQLVHEKCSSPEMPALFMQDLTDIIKKIVAKDSLLQKKFTPKPPILLQRIRIDHPFLSRGFVGAINVIRERLRSQI